MDKKQMSSTCPNCFKIFDFFINIKEFEDHWETKYVYCPNCSKPVYFGFYHIYKLTFLSGVSQYG
jgi:hypothetical protein